MAQAWFPVALAMAIGGSFALWYSLNDWERARYFGMVVALPVTVFAAAGIVNRYVLKK